MASYVQVDGMGEDSNIFSSRVRGHFIEEECKHALCSPGGGGTRSFIEPCKEESSRGLGDGWGSLFVNGSVNDVSVVSGAGGRWRVDDWSVLRCPKIP